MIINCLKPNLFGIPGWRSGLAPAFGPGRDPGDPGSSPTSGSLHGACFSLCLCLCLSLSVFLKNKKIKYFFKKILFIHETQREREAETQAEGEAGSMQGALCGTRSGVSRITPWAEGGAKLLSHRAAPKFDLSDASP